MLIYQYNRLGTVACTYTADTWRNNNVIITTSFWRLNDIVITSFVRWVKGNFAGDGQELNCVWKSFIQKYILRIVGINAYFVIRMATELIRYKMVSCQCRNI